MSHGSSERPDTKLHLYKCIFEALLVTAELSFSFMLLTLSFFSEKIILEQSRTAIIQLWVKVAKMEELILKIIQTKQSFLKRNLLKQGEKFDSQISHTVGWGVEIALPCVCAPRRTCARGCASRTALLSLETLCLSSSCAVSVFSPSCTLC